MTTWAFLDESGDPNLDVEKGATTHYAVGAVVVEEADLDALRAKVEAVRKHHFQTGPMKSSALRKNPARRLDVLRALDETGYRMLGLVVDKRRLDKESGLKFRASFKKFIDRFMYTKLFRAFPELHVRADRHGRPSFMESFERYLKRDWKQLDLLARPPEIQFVGDESEVLVQAADVVAGSLRVAYEDETSLDDAREILSHFHRASLGIQEWPAAPRSAAALAPVDDPSDFDDIVRRAAEGSAYAFLQASKDEDDPVSLMQVELLQELVRASRFDEEPRIRRDALVAWLHDRGYRDCKSEFVRRQLIGPMRDREVLIVSSAKGYRLASSVGDIDAHLALMESVVGPILGRVAIMQTLLKRVSIGKLDLMAFERFGYLRGLLEAHAQYALTNRASGEDPA